MRRSRRWRVPVLESDDDTSPSNISVLPTHHELNESTVAPTNKRVRRVAIPESPVASEGLAPVPTNLLSSPPSIEVNDSISTEKTDNHSDNNIRPVFASLCDAPHLPINEQTSSPSSQTIADHSIRVLPKQDRQLVDNLFSSFLPPPSTLPSASLPSSSISPQEDIRNHIFQSTIESHFNTFYPEKQSALPFTNFLSQGKLGCNTRQHTLGGIPGDIIGKSLHSLLLPQNVLDANNSSALSDANAYQQYIESYSTSESSQREVDDSSLSFRVWLMTSKPLASRFAGFTNALYSSLESSTLLVDELRQATRLPHLLHHIHLPHLATQLATVTTDNETNFSRRTRTALRSTNEFLFYFIQSMYLPQEDALSHCTLSALTHICTASLLPSHLYEDTATSATTDLKPPAPPCSSQELQSGVISMLSEMFRPCIDQPSPQDCSIEQVYEYVFVLLLTGRCQTAIDFLPSVLASSSSQPSSSSTQHVAFSTLLTLLSIYKHSTLQPCFADGVFLPLPASPDLETSLDVSPHLTLARWRETMPELASKPCVIRVLSLLQGDIKPIFGDIIAALFAHTHLARGLYHDVCSPSVPSKHSSYEHPQSLTTAQIATALQQVCPNSSPFISSAAHVEVSSTTTATSTASTDQTLIAACVLRFSATWFWAIFLNIIVHCYPIHLITKSFDPLALESLRTSMKDELEPFHMEILCTLHTRVHYSPLQLAVESIDTLIMPIWQSFLPCLATPLENVIVELGQHDLFHTENNAFVQTMTILGTIASILHIDQHSVSSINAYLQLSHISCQTVQSTLITHQRALISSLWFTFQTFLTQDCVLLPYTQHMAQFCTGQTNQQSDLDTSGATADDDDDELSFPSWNILTNEQHAATPTRASVLHTTIANLITANTTTTAGNEVIDWKFVLHCLDDNIASKWSTHYSIVIALWQYAHMQCSTSRTIHSVNKIDICEPLYEPKFVTFEDLVTIATHPAELISPHLVQAYISTQPLHEMFPLATNAQINMISSFSSFYRSLRCRGHWQLACYLVQQNIASPSSCLYLITAGVQTAAMASKMQPPFLYFESQQLQQVSNDYNYAEDVKQRHLTNIVTYFNNHGDNENENNDASLIQDHVKHLTTHLDTSVTQNFLTDATCQAHPNLLPVTPGVESVLARMYEHSNEDTQANSEMIWNILIHNVALLPNDILLDFHEEKNIVDTSDQPFERLFRALGLQTEVIASFYKQNKDFELLQQQNQNQQESSVDLDLSLNDSMTESTRRSNTNSLTKSVYADTQGWHVGIEEIHNVCDFVRTLCCFEFEQWYNTNSSSSSSNASSSSLLSSAPSISQLDSLMTHVRDPTSNDDVLTFLTSNQMNTSLLFNPTQYTSIIRSLQTSSTSDDVSDDQTSEQNSTEIQSFYHILATTIHQYVTMLDNLSYTDRWLVQACNISPSLITLARYAQAIKSLQQQQPPSSSSTGPNAYLTTVLQFVLLLRFEMQSTFESQLQHTFAPFQHSPDMCHNIFSHFSQFYPSSSSLSELISHPMHISSCLHDIVTLPISLPLETATIPLPNVISSSSHLISLLHDNGCYPTTMTTQISQPTASMLTFSSLWINHGALHVAFLSCFSLYIIPVLLTTSTQQSPSIHVDSSDANTTMSAQLLSSISSCFFLPLVHMWASCAQFVEPSALLSHLSQQLFNIQPTNTSQSLTPLTDNIIASSQLLTDSRGQFPPCFTPTSVRYPLLTFGSMLVGYLAPETQNLVHIFGSYYLQGVIYRVIETLNCLQEQCNQLIDSSNHIISWDDYMQLYEVSLFTESSNPTRKQSNRHQQQQHTLSLNSRQEYDVTTFLTLAMYICDSLFSECHYIPSISIQVRGNQSYTALSQFETGNKKQQSANSHQILSTLSSVSASYATAISRSLNDTSDSSSSSSSQSQLQMARSIYRTLQLFQTLLPPILVNIDSLQVLLGDISLIMHICPANISFLLLPFSTTMFNIFYKFNTLRNHCEQFILQQRRDQHYKL